MNKRTFNLALKSCVIIALFAGAMMAPQMVHAQKQTRGLPENVQPDRGNLIHNKFVANDKTKRVASLPAQGPTQDLDLIDLQEPVEVPLKAPLKAGQESANAPATNDSTLPQDTDSVLDLGGFSQDDVEVFEPPSPIQMKSPQSTIPEPSFQQSLDQVPGSVELFGLQNQNYDLGYPVQNSTGRFQSARQQFLANGRAPYNPVLNHGDEYDYYRMGHQPFSPSLLPGQPGHPMPQQRGIQRNQFQQPIPNEPERQQFWDQFPTTPPEGGKYARTEGYDSIGAILANGYAYGRVEFAVMEPHFQNNGGLNISDGPLMTSEQFDFGFEFTPRYIVGFETNAGPGIELNHWQFNEFSNGLAFQSNGISAGEISTIAGGNNGSRTIVANIAGQSLDSRHHMKIQSTAASFFKAFDAPVSRIRGMLGMRYVATQHDLIANRSDGASLFNNTNFQGGGPTIGIDYFRPVGHTQLNLLGGFSFSLLFGHHDQTIAESGVVTFRETATNSQMAIFDMHLGAEWRRKVSRCNSVLIRGTFESQHWLNGGSAVDPNSDFGIYGFVFSAGFTR